MSSPAPTLESLRREIDTIDTAIHDLLMRRAQVVERVAQAKTADSGGGPRIIFRPGREAAILRRIIARHQGSFPVGAIVRIWREIISAMTLIQGPFSAAVYAPGENRAYWDLARDHYGSVAPLLPVNSVQGVLRALADGTAVVGVVPLPQEEDSDPWWRSLMRGDDKTPRIISRLPFVVSTGASSGRSGAVDALVLACAPLEATGQDRTLLGVELAADVSRGRLKDLVEAAGMPVCWFRTYNFAGGGGSAHLVEVDDYVGEDDPRLAALAEKAGDALARVLPIGAYALQVTAP